MWTLSNSRDLESSAQWDFNTGTTRVTVCEYFKYETEKSFNCDASFSQCITSDATGNNATGADGTSKAERDVA